jgi:hypothetical protein
MGRLQVPFGLDRKAGGTGALHFWIEGEIRLTIKLLPWSGN